jgi:hypothetical protein
MKLILVLMAIPFLVASECGKKKKTGEEQKEVVEQVKDSVPACVRRMIDEGNSKTPSNAPTQVSEYLYKGKKVYLTTAPCCDQYNGLYDDNCQHLCAPTGGITGKGDGKCPDFSTTAKFVRLVWRKASQ